MYGRQSSVMASVRKISLGETRHCPFVLRDIFPSSHQTQKAKGSIFLLPLMPGGLLTRLQFLHPSPNVNTPVCETQTLVFTSSWTWSYLKFAIPVFLHMCMSGNNSDRPTVGKF